MNSKGEDNDWVNLEDGAWEDSGVSHSTVVKRLASPRTETGRLAGIDVSTVVAGTSMIMQNSGKKKRKSRIKLQGAMQVPSPESKPLSAMIESINRRQQPRIHAPAPRQDSNRPPPELINALDPFSMVGITPTEQAQQDQLIRRVKKIDTKTDEPDYTEEIGKEHSSMFRMEDSSGVGGSGWGIEEGEDDDILHLVGRTKRKKGAKKKRGLGAVAL
ncbi:hypothetical protein AAMO2058_000847200 [Amorphochlora amoebiformis]